MNEGLQQALEISGGQTGLARRIYEATGNKLTAQAIQKWCRRGIVPLGRVLDVEKATGFAVSRQKLRPDFFRIEQGESNGDSHEQGQARTTGAGDTAPVAARNGGRTEWRKSCVARRGKRGGPSRCS